MFLKIFSFISIVYSSVLCSPIRHFCYVVLFYSGTNKFHRPRHRRQFRCHRRPLLSPLKQHHHHHSCSREFFENTVKTESRYSIRNMVQEERIEQPLPRRQQPWRAGDESVISPICMLSRRWVWCVSIMDLWHPKAVDNRWKRSDCKTRKECNH